MELIKFKMNVARFVLGMSVMVGFGAEQNTEEIVVDTGWICVVNGYVLATFCIIVMINR